MLNLILFFHWILLMDVDWKFILIVADYVKLIITFIWSNLNKFEYQSIKPIDDHLLLGIWIILQATINWLPQKLNNKVSFAYWKCWFGKVNHWLNHWIQSNCVNRLKDIWTKRIVLLTTINKLSMRRRLLIWCFENLLFHLPNLSNLLIILTLINYTLIINLHLIKLIVWYLNINCLD